MSCWWQAEAAGLKELISYFVEFRHEVVVRRTQYDLRKAQERAHILEGLLIALDNLDEVINLIRSSKTPDDAKEGLMTRFGLSDIQSKAILGCDCKGLLVWSVTRSG